jgi:hypothetical protein
MYYFSTKTYSFYLRKMTNPSLLNVKRLYILVGFAGHDVFLWKLFHGLAK